MTKARKIGWQWLGRLALIGILLPVALALPLVIHQWSELPLLVVCLRFLPLGIGLWLLAAWGLLVRFRPACPGCDTPTGRVRVVERQVLVICPGCGGQFDTGFVFPEMDGLAGGH